MVKENHSFGPINHCTSAKNCHFWGIKSNLWSFHLIFVYLGLFQNTRPERVRATEAAAQLPGRLGRLRKKYGWKVKSPVRQVFLHRPCLSRTFGVLGQKKRLNCCNISGFFSPLTSRWSSFLFPQATPITSSFHSCCFSHPHSVTHYVTLLGNEMLQLEVMKTPAALPCVSCLLCHSWFIFYCFHLLGQWEQELI